MARRISAHKGNPSKLSSLLRFWPYDAKLKENEPGTLAEGEVEFLADGLYGLLMDGIHFFVR